MEAVVHRERPTSQPEEGIISGGKDPDNGQVCYCEYAGAVADIPYELLSGLIVTGKVMSA
jgi:hypothetical protein